MRLRYLALVLLVVLAAVLVVEAVFDSALAAWIAIGAFAALLVIRGIIGALGRGLDDLFDIGDD